MYVGYTTKILLMSNVYNPTGTPRNSPNSHTYCKSHCNSATVSVSKKYASENSMNSLYLTWGVLINVYTPVMTCMAPTGTSM